MDVPDVPHNLTSLDSWTHPAPVLAIAPAIEKGAPMTGVKIGASLDKSGSPPRTLFVGTAVGEWPNSMTGTGWRRGPESCSGHQNNQISQSGQNRLLSAATGSRPNTRAPGQGSLGWSDPSRRRRDVAPFHSSMTWLQRDLMCLWGWLAHTYNL